MREYYFSMLHKWDLIGRIHSILHPNGPWVIDPRDNKIQIPLEGITKDINTPWVHIKSSAHRRCKIYQEIFVGCLDVLPYQCLNCWKVVFRPQYLRDMLNMIPLMERLAKEHGYCSKLGSEERLYTSGIYGKSGLWGCYFYNDSKEDGLGCWDTVRRSIEGDDALHHLLDDIDEDGYPTRLVLKRGCTEFEVMNKFGDSKDWELTDEAKEWEGIVWARLKKQQMSPVQGQDIRNHVIKRWFQHAHHAGDPTVKDYNEGTMLWKTPRFYHKECKIGGTK
jgi:hypothetical protein